MPEPAVEMHTSFSPDDESLQRNRWLVRRYGRIPSYGLWTPHSVGNDRSEWIAWWREVLSEQPAVAPHARR